jgi:hypothetical protein
MIKYLGIMFDPHKVVEYGVRKSGNFKLIGDSNPNSKGLLIRHYVKGSIVKFERIH